MDVEEYERVAAKQRQLAAQNNNAVTEKIPEQDKGESREKAAAKVGTDLLDQNIDQVDGRPPAYGKNSGGHERRRPPRWKPCAGRCVIY